MALNTAAPCDQSSAVQRLHSESMIEGTIHIRVVYKHVRSVHTKGDRACAKCQAMAEGMTPPQGSDAREREAMLKRIAKLAKHQGSFHLACKKYTQV